MAHYDPTYWAKEHKVVTLCPHTGHMVRAIAFCESNETAKKMAAAIEHHSAMLAYIRRCASNCAEANDLLKRIEGQP